MIYKMMPPHIDNMLWLTKLARPFPKTAGEILAIAKLWNFNKDTQDFLRLFPEGETFENGDDFLARTEEVALLLHEKSGMPAETALSP